MAIKGLSASVILAAAACMLAPDAAGAQTDPAAELDPLAQAASDPADGLALARRQRDSGELIDALATLERVMLMHPASAEARLLHAGLLCRLDDPDGARGELDRLSGIEIGEPAWAEFRIACGDMPRPQAGQGAGSHGEGAR